MVFSSLLFLFRFLPAILLAYYLVPHRCRNFVLLVFSLGFYAWGEPVYLILMLVSVLISYTGGILVDRLKRKEKRKAARAMLIISCTLSLSPLVFFKYAGFAMKTVDSLVGSGIPVLHIAMQSISKITLPIGISFYTFQTLSYIVDVYRGEAEVQKNVISFGTYVTMFPQLIAGPIVQYKTIDTQLRTRTETTGQFAEGVHRFMIGLGKKVLIANNAGMLWDTIQASSYSELPVLTAWMGIAAYTFQIYFDFSGYSDMAVGLGDLFGFRFPENFQYPYISKSITEFWHRWHISLGTWFREYVYIPLGGNRVSKWRHIRNILVVWLLTGIWHGASWNFLMWGIYYGVLLLAEKHMKVKCHSGPDVEYLTLGEYLNRLSAPFGHIYCMFFVMLGWNLFAFDNVGQGMEYLRALFGLYGQGGWNSETLYLLYNNLVLLLLCVLGSTRLPQRAGRELLTRLAEREGILAVVKNTFYIGIFLLSVAWLVDAAFNPFLYFRF